MKLYRFVDEQKAEGFPIERICEIAGVSTSAYYDWKQHRCGIVTAGELRERLLVNEIRQIHKTWGRLHQPDELLGFETLSSCRADRADEINP